MYALFCIIVSYVCRPDLIDWRSVRNVTVRERLERAFFVAERDCGVTRLLDPEGKPHSHSLHVYVVNTTIQSYLIIIHNETVRSFKITILFTILPEFLTLGVWWKLSYTWGEYQTINVNETVSCNMEHVGLLCTCLMNNRIKCTATYFRRVNIKSGLVCTCF